MTLFLLTLTLFHFKKMRQVVLNEIFPRPALNMNLRVTFFYLFIYFPTCANTMGAKISLPANYATDFKELKSDLLKRYNWKNIEHSVLEHSSVGFLCRVKATNARKQELTRVVKAIYVNTNEFNLDLDKIIIDSDCRNLVKIHDIVTVDDKV